MFAKSFGVYRELGQFQYQHQDFTSGPIQQSIFIPKFCDKAFYLGQLKEGTDIKEGIGIVVYSSGCTLKLNNKVYLRDIEKMVLQMEKEEVSFIMETTTLENSKMAYDMDVELIILQTELDMKESGRKTTNMDKVLITCQMETGMREITEIIRGMDKGLITERAGESLQESSKMV